MPVRRLFMEEVALPVTEVGPVDFWALRWLASIRGSGHESAAVRDGWAEPASAEGSGERDAVAGVQLVGEGSDGSVLRGGVRPVRRVLPSAAVRTSGAGPGFDGAV